MPDYIHPFDNDGRPRQLNGSQPNGLWKSAFGMKRWEDIGVAQSEMLYPWVVENIIPECESILGYGHTGSGKTFGFFDLALHIAQGMKFNGYNVQGGLVIYHAVEAGKGFEKRVVAYAKHYEIQGQPLPFVLLTKKVNLFDSDEGAKQLITEIQHIKAEYEEPLRLLFLDTMSAATPGMNENQSQDVTPVRRRVDMIRDSIGASVIIVHHMAKGGTTPRGHSSLSADYETTIEFETTLDRDPIHGLPVHKATVQKQREGVAGLSWSFVCKAIQVGTNMWGNPETSCVALPIDAHPTREKSERGAFKIYSEKCKAVFACLLKAIKIHGEPAPQELQLPLGTMVVHGTRWWEAYKEIDEHDSADDTPEKEEWRAKDAIKTHGLKLLNLGIIGRSKPWAWWTGKAIQGFPETYGDPFHKPVPRPFTETEVEF